MCALLLPRSASLDKPGLGAVIDPSHPLSHQLRLLYSFNQGGGGAGGGRIQNVANYDERIFFDTQDWRHYPGDPRYAGMGLHFNGTSNDGQSNDAIDLSFTREITVAVLVSFPSVITSDLVIIESSGNYNSGSGGYIVNTTTGGKVAGIRHHTAGGAQSTYNGCDVPQAAGTHLYTFVLNNRDLATGYRDGVSDYVKDPSGGTAGDALYGNHTLFFGARNRASLWYAGGLLGVWLWTRSLTKGEIMEHAQAPWQMVRTPTPTRWVVLFQAGGDADKLAIDSQAVGSLSEPTVAATLVTTDSQAIGSLSEPTTAVAVAVADAQAIGAVATATVRRLTVAADSQAIGSASATSLTVAAVAADAQTIGSSDLTTTTVAATVVDGQAIAGTVEVSAGEALDLGVADSQAIAAVAAVAVSARPTAADSQPIGSTSALGLGVATTATDAQSIGAVTTTAVATAVAIADAQAVDAVAVPTVDFGAPVVPKSVSDSQAIGSAVAVTVTATAAVTDASAIAGAAVPATVVAVDVADTQPIGAVAVSSKRVPALVRLVARQHVEAGVDATAIVAPTLVATLVPVAGLVATMEGDVDQEYFAGQTVRFWLTDMYTADGTPIISGATGTAWVERSREIVGPTVPIAWSASRLAWYADVTLPDSPGACRVLASVTALGLTGKWGETVDVLDHH